MKKAGMSLSLGCDGSSTNDSPSLLDSLQMACLMQSFYSKERGWSPSFSEMLKMAAVGGAEMMERNDIGTFEAGKGADFFMIDTEKLELSGALHDLQI